MLSKIKNILIGVVLISCGSVFADQSEVVGAAGAFASTRNISNAGEIAEPLSELEKTAAKLKHSKMNEYFEHWDEYVPIIYDSKKELQVFALGNDIKAKLLKRSRLYKNLAHKIESAEDRNLQTINPETVGKHLNVLAALLYAVKTASPIEPIGYGLTKINMLRQMHGGILADAREHGASECAIPSTLPKCGSVPSIPDDEEAAEHAE